MDALIETLKNLGPARLSMMMLTFFGLIIFFIFIAVKSSAPSMTLLYADLSTSDSTEISAKLDISKIPYTFSPDGKEILVPGQEVGRARMLLAEDGLPHGGSMGYEIFDKKQGFGTTNFVQNVNQLRALEGELARTIGTMEQIRSARVHLVLPQRELFSRESKPATASVFINIRNSAQMGPEQIAAIQHLVASAVPQLKATAVSIIDNNGNLLARGEEDGVKDSLSAQTSTDMKSNYERNLSRNIEDLLSRVVGFGRVRAQVTADIDFDVVTRNSESYDPEGQVVRSTQNVTDDSKDSSGSNDQTVSVQNNLPGLPANGGSSTAGGSSTNRAEETVNYEISKTIESVVRGGGDVKKLSVAVLVDGKYETDTAATASGQGDIGKEEAKGESVAPVRKYIPRSKEELDQISALVKSAIGYDESRGDTVEVVNMPFSGTDEMFDPVKDDLIFGFEKGAILGVVETLTLSMVAILVILLVLRPMATHIAAASAASAEGAGSAQKELAMLTGQTGTQAALAPPGSSGISGIPGADEPSELENMINMSQVEGKVKASSVQKISELVNSHPNETVAVIRSWMSQEG